MSVPILDDYDLVTFDCYGTLVDWEAGIVACMQPMLLSHDVHVNDETILEFFAAWEPEEQRDGIRYRAVLENVMRRFGNRLAFEPSSDEIESFVQCIPQATPFDDTCAALSQLNAAIPLAVISNTDDDLFALTAQNLDIDFAHVITAEATGAYKPNAKMFDSAFAVIGRDTRVLHVAQSKFHDIQPMHERGVDTVWITRDSTGIGAVKEVAAQSDWTYEDLAGFVADFTRA